MKTIHVQQHTEQIASGQTPTDRICPTVHKNREPHPHDCVGRSLKVRSPITDDTQPTLDLERLLMRPMVDFENQVNHYFANKRILVTGAAGSIGSELVRRLKKLNPTSLLLIDQAESPMYKLENEIFTESHVPTSSLKVIFEVESIQNKPVMERLLATHRPEIVFHAAAYKHVPLMERNPRKALEINTLGTRQLADLSVLHDVQRFVFVSTDKAVNPTSVMGASKRAAEMYLQSLNGIPDMGTRFITARFGNVMESNGSVIPLFRKQISAGGPVTITHPAMQRYLMTTPEACALLLEACAKGNGGEVFVSKLGDPVSVLELACQLIRLYGKVPYIDIPITFTGIRPGEKLREVLLSEGEKASSVLHRNVSVAFPKVSDHKAMKQELEAATVRMGQISNEEVIRFFQKLVPEYAPPSTRNPYAANPTFNASPIPPAHPRAT
jgi:FlaA1/EpsC-like NDP-sugar epimerase